MKKLHMLDGVTLTSIDFTCRTCNVPPGIRCLTPDDAIHAAREASLKVIADAAHLEVVDE